MMRRRILGIVSLNDLALAGAGPRALSSRRSRRDQSHLLGSAAGGRLAATRIRAPAVAHVGLQRVESAEQRI
jgi:hypothetical protein